MRSPILKEIYSGSYDPRYRRGSRHSEYDMSYERALIAYEKLLEVIPDELKTQFKGFADSCFELMECQNEEDFEDGYRMGAQMMIAALATEEQMRDVRRALGKNE